MRLLPHTDAADSNLPNEEENLGGLPEVCGLLEGGYGWAAAARPDGGKLRFMDPFCWGVIGRKIDMNSAGPGNKR